MHISKIENISNYRNLSGKNISFDERINFFIGENNIGKTNLLELLNIIFNIGKFNENDFYNINQSVEIKFTIKYDSDELSFFEENFDIDDEFAINIIARQNGVDEKIEYFNDSPNNYPITFTNIKKLNALYYYAQRTPSKEIDFRKTQGSGRVLNYLVKSSLKTNGFEEKDIIEFSKIKSIIEGVNKHISNLNSVTGDKIQAYINNEPDKIISGILNIGDHNNRELSSLGEGVQYAFNILLQIIDIIYNVKNLYKDDFTERIIQSEAGNIFPIFIMLDEPEIHQHPFRQRCLIKKIQDILENKNLAFCQLLKDLFDIDGLKGQIFIATHSPNILLSEYNQFIRFYLEKGSTVPNIISGKNIALDDDLYKHLLHNYIYMKEAMFSKSIIFVEGDTEYGAIPLIAKRLNIDFDEKSIGVIKLDGADSVKKCLELYSQFGMKAIAILDRDKYDLYNDIDNVYFTEGKDFEEDMYDNFELKDYLEFCKELQTLYSYIQIMKNKAIEFDVKEFIENPSNLEIESNIQKEIMDENKEEQLDKLRNTKNTLKGYIISKYVTNIPTAYKSIIEMLKDDEV